MPRIYQAVFKIGMYIIPWGMPETLEGAGCVTKLPALIKEKGFKKVLVVTDSVLMGLGLLDSMFKAMDEVGVEYVVYDGVQPNPTDINVSEGLKLYEENHCDAMVAFGGGSPMDCCKGIGAVHARKGKTVEQLQGLFHVLHKIPTIFAVPTTAGTGSETTVAAVITDHAHSSQSVDERYVSDAEIRRARPGTDRRSAAAGHLHDRHGRSLPRGGSLYQSHL